ncbi:uncharacterized protein [Diadema setosum]|uniref:uncharacterized protein n=1 Tax=Diadema setosum TaxID=31175 RepID=UPI003B3A8693
MAVSKLYVQLAACSTALLVAALFALRNACGSAAGSCWKCIGWGMLGLGLLGLSLVYLWILSQRPSRRHTFKTVSQFGLIVLVIKCLHNLRSYPIAKASWQKPREHQERLLIDIIKKNGNTEYGRRFGLQGVKSLDDLRRRHPLTTYEHYRGYVERMMNGETNILTAKTPASFVRTTGTTGRSKHIPLTSKIDLFGRIGTTLNLTLMENYPDVSLLQKQLNFYVSPRVFRAKSGALIEPIGRFPDEYKTLLLGYTSPPEGFQLETIFEANYIHLLFGLLDSDAGMIYVTFMHFLRSALRQLSRCWPDIVHDIEHGTIKSSLDLPPHIRASLTAALGGGDPGRAAELRREFEKGFSGLMKRVWPRLRVINSIDHTGIWPQIEGTWAKGVDHLPLMFASSEAFICPYLGLKSMDVHGHLPLPSIVVTEFIKDEDSDQSQPKTYFMDEVEVGQCYEVALTHEWFGFYRYRMGDIFRVVGFHENCPILQFQYRTGLVLNLCYEKLNTHVVDEAIKAAVARWPGVSLTEYTVAESPLVPEDSPGDNLPYYYVFLELAPSQKSLTDEEKKAVDDELRLRNGDYDRLRREGSISHPRVYSVRSGGFEALRDHILQNTNATPSQYKIPQKLRSYSFFKIMVAQSLP